MLAAIWQKNSRGQSVVELALVMPFLIMLLAGAVDFANAFRMEIALSTAAREGASWAASDSNTTNICNRVSESVAGTNLSVSCAVTYPTGITGCTGSRIAGCPVRVTASASAPTYFGGILGLNTIPLSDSTNMVVVKP